MGSLTANVDRPTKGKMRSILSLTVVSLFVAVNGLPSAGPYAAKVAKVNLLPSDGDTGKDPVSGELFLKQTPAGVFVSGKILGLEPGKHGFHVHAVGDLGNGCKNAGGHFNPQMKQQSQLMQTVGMWGTLATL